MTVYLLNRFENIVTKGELPCTEQFFLLLQSFHKLSAAEVSERVCMWERVNPGSPTCSTNFTHLQKTAN